MIYQRGLIYSCPTESFGCNEASRGLVDERSLAQVVEYEADVQQEFMM